FLRDQSGFRTDARRARVMRLDFLLLEQIWRGGVYLFFGLILFYLVAPMLAIVPLSFNAHPVLSYPLEHLSLRWYEQLFGSAEWMLAFKNSIIVAGAVVGLSTTLGTLTALGFTLANFPLKSAVLGLIVSPMMVPHIITGVGLFFLYAEVELV